MNISDHLLWRVGLSPFCLSSTLLTCVLYLFIKTHQEIDPCSKLQDLPSHTTVYNTVYTTHIVVPKIIYFPQSISLSLCDQKSWAVIK